MEKLSSIKRLTPKNDTIMKRLFVVCMMMAIASLYVNAQTKCNNCSGSGLEERACAFCKGEGYRECDFCLGKKSVRCNMCQGSGEVVCAHCRGNGGTKVKDQWRECQWCGGKGTPECEECKGTGSKVCWKCSGAGEYVCNQCNGEKVTKWQCHVCSGTGQVKDDAEVTISKLKEVGGTSGTVKVNIDPNDSEEEKMRKIARARLAHRKKVLESRGVTVR